MKKTVSFIYLFVCYLISAQIFGKNIIDWTTTMILFTGFFFMVVLILDEFQFEERIWKNKEKLLVNYSLKLNKKLKEIKND